LNENMDMVDSALGDLTSVPTSSKTAAGAIAELHEAMQNIGFEIPDGSVTPIKLSFDPAIQAELDAHVTSTTVHGATSAATASKIVIRDSNGRAQVASPTSAADIARLDTVLKKFGAVSTTGILDWNDETNTQPGVGPTLLYGTATNGPGGNGYYHPLNFEYGTKDGTGQITQYAIPYAQSEPMASGLKYRSRYSGVWSAWHRLWGDGQLRVTAGNLEFHDGSAWKKVGGGEMSAYPNVVSALGRDVEVLHNSYLTVVDISGKKGILSNAGVRSAGVGSTSQFIIRITIDGVVKFHANFRSNSGGFAGVLRDNTRFNASSITAPVPITIAAIDSYIKQLPYPYVSSNLSEYNDYVYSILPDPIYFDNSLKVEISNNYYIPSYRACWEVDYSTN
jgi:hypothetical protein